MWRKEKAKQSKANNHSNTTERDAKRLANCFAKFDSAFLTFSFCHAGNLLVGLTESQLIFYSSKRRAEPAGLFAEFHFLEEVQLDLAGEFADDLGCQVGAVGEQVKDGVGVDESAVALGQSDQFEVVADPLASFDELHDSGAGVGFVGMVLGEDVHAALLVDNELGLGLIGDACFEWRRVVQRGGALG